MAFFKKYRIPLAVFLIFGLLLVGALVYAGAITNCCEQLQGRGEYGIELEEPSLFFMLPPLGLN